MRSATLGEPLQGRAGYAKAWLAVEHPGPWPRDAVAASLAPFLLRPVPDGVRIVLIRKRAARSGPERPRVFLAWAGGPRSWVRTTRIGGYDELPGLIGRLGDEEPELGERPERTLALVCTHGRRDACCAEFGRPLLDTLRDRTDTDVWESTHVGGDRFAANMVILPEGLHYSRLTPHDAHLAIDAYARNELHLPSFRGRASRTMAEQAAEHLARLHEGHVGIDDLTVLRTTVHDDEHRARVRVAGRTLDIRFRAVPVSPGGVVHGCPGGATPASWTMWEPISLVDVT